LLLLAAMAAGTGEAEAMLYHPDRGAMWDPSILWYDGNYHAFMLPKEEGNPGAGYWGLPVSAPKPFARAASA
jgi:hypothetical protein